MIEMEKIYAFRDRIVKQFHPEKVILFGSYAYGNPTPDSDVDVLVVLPFKGKVVHKATEIMTTVKHPGFPVDMLVRTPRQVEERISLGDFFMKEILEKGTVIYEAAYA